ncbi:MAG: hypothetical protein JWP83_3796 [Mycobacterium sp.]|jgi:hypothetical protein|uniref:hypothetical protein n=1 Tax=Mycobacterium sp. TaxID=1785 RepID=UPI00261BAD6B|nr:hypothetical protein [Mycobacterium sp.]MCW2662644.1 hypothetical protein [Mycobacterium sp.]
MFDLEAEDYADTYMSVKQYAALMNITEGRVRHLARYRVLRSRYFGGDVFVQPAAVAGYTA